MGGKQCQLKNFSMRKLQDSELVQEISDPLAGRLKVFRILRPPYDYVVEHRIFVQQQDIQKVRKRALVISQIQRWGEHLISGLNADQYSSCGRMTQLSFYFQYHKYTLLDAVRDYKCKQRFFQQDQLIYIVTAVSHVLLRLNHLNIIHASINSESILLDLRKLPKLKLSHLLHDFNVSQLKKLMPRAFYSPQERQNRMIDYLKCDIFSLGICALQAMSLEEAKAFYQYNKPKMDVIKQTILRHKHIYPKLCVLISGMLEPDPKKRFSLETIIELAEGPQSGQQQDQTLQCIEQPRREGKKIKTVRPLDQVF